MNLTDEQYIEIGQPTTALVHNIFDGIYSNAEDCPTAEQETGSDIDFYPWMTKLQEWQRLHEKTDRETLMGIFRDAGFEFDPALLPWCGAGLRAALIHSGCEDRRPINSLWAISATYTLCRLTTIAIAATLFSA